jgi:hypothetical protein
MSNASSVIEKVRKLLTLSKSDNIHEANAALQTANKLIEQYRLSESELEINDNFECEAIVDDDKPLYESGRITRWKSLLAQVLARHYGCALWNAKSYRSNSYQLVGRKSDIEIVRYMFAWLSMEADRLSSSLSKKQGHDRSSGKIFCASYCLGFASGISEQLNASKKSAAEKSTSQAITKLDSRLAEAEAFMRSARKLEKNPRKCTNSNVDASAFYNGKSHGNSIHLGAAMSGSSTKLLGSG